MQMRDQINLDLACQGLYWVARGMDLRRQASWDALVAVAGCIAEKYKTIEGPIEEPLDILLKLEQEVKDGQHIRNGN